MLRASSRVKSRFFRRFIDSAVSEECSCCKTISSTVPASSGRSLLAVTNLSFTKLTWTEPPLTLKRKTPSGLSLTDLPSIFKTSSRRLLKGCIPFHEAARTSVAKLAQARTETTNMAVTKEARLCSVERLMAKMLIEGYCFAKGRRRSSDSLKSASLGATSRAF
jgi:hypothetical protein